ncbi:beta strand repeat-containing protein [Robiginitalea sp. IMCC44478]|uniref:beta strand repeat-containing protein n=1 Tax=Robiginitalea sp. IMCC44478 TaxID=3459122 RepID=UPI004042BC8F
MKLKSCLILSMIFLGTLMQAQVKIGDNPQTIDPASLLELESRDKVLVISRLTTAEMNALVPLPGAFIYNTDEACIHYYDGVEWINVCDAFPLIFSTAPVVNPDTTMVLTQIGDTLHFEVGQITGNNIVDFSINGIDIQNNSINIDKLADSSVGTDELSDNAVTDEKIDLIDVTLADFINDAGYLISADLVSTDAGNDIVLGTDNGVYYDAEPLETAIAALQTQTATINLTDNGDGTYDFTDPDGNVQQINTNNLTVTDLVTGNVIATLSLADGTSFTINETVTSLTDNGDGFVTYTTEAGTTETVAKAAITDNLDGTYTFTRNDGADVTITTNGLTITDTVAGNLIATLTQADGTTATINETITSLTDNADGFVTFTKEDGTTETVAKAAITDNLDGTYTFTRNDGADVTITTNGLTITDTVAGNLIATLTQADGTTATINETITSLTDNADGFVTFTKEDGTSETVAKAAITDNLDGTYTFTRNDGADVTLDLNALALPYDNSTSGFTATNVQDAIDEIAGGSSDNQNLITDGTPGNIEIERGNIVTINTDDADPDPTNELNTSFQITNGILEIVDNGGSLQENLISIDPNNNLIAGTDGRLYLNVDAAASGETITTLTDNTDGTFTYVNENGVPVSFDSRRSTVVDNLDGTFTITDDSGTAVTINSNETTTTLTDNTDGTFTYISEDGTPTTFDSKRTTIVDNLDGTFTITDDSGNIETLTGTDDQQLDDPNTTFNAGTNELTIALEDGGTATADLSALNNPGTDDQIASEVNITDAGGNFTATEVEGALAELAAISTDDQQLDDPNTIFNAGTNQLTIALEDGGTATADLSALNNPGTDDQIASEVNITDAGGNFTATEVEGALAELAANSTDDQQLDDPNTTFNVGTNQLTIALEDGGTATADLSALNNPGTDDQTASEVNITDAGGNFTATEVEGALAELSANSTDDQQLDDPNTIFNAGTNQLTIALEDGGTATADLSALDNPGTDDQQLDDPNTLFNAGTNQLTIALEDGGTATADLSVLNNPGTDDQQLDDPNTTFNAGTNQLTIALEDGGTATADLSALNNPGTDDQIASEVNITDAGGNFTATQVEGALAELAAGSTDDQQLDDPNTIFNAGTNQLTIALEDGGTATADLSALNNPGTDDQQLDDPNTTFNAGTNQLTIALEDGGTATADLSALNNPGTDDQIASEVNITDAGGNFTATEVEGALAELAANSTDDQQLDDPNTTFNAGTNQLTIALEDGGTATADLSALNNPGTDDQTATEVNIVDAGGNFTATEVEGALAELAAIAGTNLANTDLTQTATTYRTYDINGGDLVFAGGIDENFGIGSVFSLVSPPAEKLDVDGNVRARLRFVSGFGSQSDPNFGFTQETTRNTGMFRLGENRIGFATGSTLAVSINDRSAETTNTNSTLEINGSFAPTLTTTTGVLTLSDAHHTIVIASSSHTITLPAAGTANNRMYIIKNPNGAATSISSYINETGASDSQVDAQSVLWLQSDGTNWQQIN